MRTAYYLKSDIKCAWYDSRMKLPLPAGPVHIFSFPACLLFLKASRTHVLFDLRCSHHTALTDKNSGKQKPERSFDHSGYLLRKMGLEPTRHNCHKNLNLARLPIPTLPHSINLLKKAMQKKGLEPSPCCQDRHLKPARLPIPPLLQAIYLSQASHIIPRHLKFVNSKIIFVI